MLTESERLQTTRQTSRRGRASQRARIGRHWRTCCALHTSSLVQRAAAQQRNTRHGVGKKQQFASAHQRRTSTRGCRCALPSYRLASHRPTLSTLLIESERRCLDHHRTRTSACFSDGPRDTTRYEMVRCTTRHSVLHSTPSSTSNAFGGKKKDLATW